MGDVNIGKIVMMFVVFLFSTACHEAAHAWTAWKWGDSTAKDLGRVTLNPIPHIDPIGTLLLPLMVLFMTGGAGIMGWASTPVDKSQMRDPKWGDFWTSAAGPLTNLGLAIISLIVLKTVRTFLGGSLGEYTEAVAFLLVTMVWMNLFLMVLNFLPIPPLDGGHMLESVLPPRMAEVFEQIRPFGLIILIAVSASGMLNNLTDPLIRWAFSIL